MHPALKKLGTIGIVAGLAYMSVFGVPTDWLGEVVEVETYDPRGMSFHPSAWIVAGNGAHLLRASTWDVGWLDRLRSHPDIHITRDGVRSAFRAEIADAALDRVNHWMREKYGRSDELMTAFRDPAEATAIRLIPVVRDRSWSEQYP